MTFGLKYENERKATGQTIEDRDGVPSGEQPGQGPRSQEEMRGQRAMLREEEDGEHETSLEKAQRAY